MITTRLIGTQFNAKGISPIPDIEVAPLKMFSTGFALPRGTKRKLTVAARNIFPDQEVQAMISDVINISIERGHGNTVRPNKVRYPPAWLEQLCTDIAERHHRSWLA